MKCQIECQKHLAILELSQDSYNTFISMDCDTFKKEIVKSLPPEIEYGYGYYGCSMPYENNGRYFVDCSIGNSCD